MGNFLAALANRLGISLGEDVLGTNGCRRDRPVPTQLEGKLMKNWKPTFLWLGYIRFLTLLVWGCAFAPYGGHDNERCDRNQYWSPNAAMCVAKPAG